MADRCAPGGEVRVALSAGTQSGSAPELEARRYDFALAERLGRDLDLSRPTAVTLIRRGIESADQARRFLGLDPEPEPEPFPNSREAAAKLRDAVSAGKRISVFGDFDVDGVCATSIMVSALRRVGADCDWLIPDRGSEGYGLREESVRRLAGRGSGLIVTVDCGITAVDEVELAKSLGVEVIVCDHHLPGAEIPDCTVLHPRVGGYSCVDLCGAAVTWKLACALTGEDGERDLDLVALATVADLVPLVGENRDLVRRGLRVARRGGRPGMRALMAAAGTVAEKLGESDLGFRLGPRINAAGRLYRADAGVELFLTEDEGRAAEIADELSRINLERQSIERQVLGEAEAVLRSRREESGADEHPTGLVVSGEGWHPGVIGIVASRLVEQYGRPAVVIGIGPDGWGRGSGRGVPGFDLLTALRGCEGLLGRYGGHRAAAGLEIEGANIGDFAEAFAGEALAQLGPEPPRSRERVDAFAAGPELGLRLAEELERLAPFGMGNPGVNLVVPSAVVSDLQPMGPEGSHLRFNVHSGGFRARAVAFGRRTLGGDQERPRDLVMRLERNEWNGSVEPRLRLRESIPVPDPDLQRYRARCDHEEWWRRFDSAFNGLDPEEADAEASAMPSSRRRHSPGTGLALLAELASSGTRVIALTGDAGRRAGLLQDASGIGRFILTDSAICSFRDGEQVFSEAVSAGFCLTDYRTLLLHGGRVGVHADFVVMIDPPVSRSEQHAASKLSHPGEIPHIVWDAAACDFTARCLRERYDLRKTLAEVYRGLRGAPEVEGSGLRTVLEGAAELPRSPEDCGLAVAILAELGLVSASPKEADICARRLGVVSSDRKDLHHSRLFRRSRELFEVSSRFLEKQRQV